MSRNPNNRCPIHSAATWSDELDHALAQSNHHTHQHPQLTANIGNLALLRLAGKLDLIPEALAEQTGALYRTLRQTQHRLRLDNQSPCRVAQGLIETAACKKLWEVLFEII